MIIIIIVIGGTGTWCAPSSDQPAEWPRLYQPVCYLDGEIWQIYSPDLLFNVWIVVKLYKNNQISAFCIYCKPACVSVQIRDSSCNYEAFMNILKLTDKPAELEAVKDKVLEELQYLRSLDTAGDGGHLQSERHTYKGHKKKEFIIVHCIPPLT